MRLPDTSIRHFVQVLTLALITATMCLSRGSGQVDVNQAQRIDKIFEQWNRSDSPGCAVAAMRNGTIAYEHGYGMADLEHGAPITGATPFHVASVSKQFTAAAIVLLAQDGKLSINDDVRKYIPDLPDFGGRITIRNLLHHTSGLRDQWDLLEFAGWRYSLDLITNHDVLDVFTRQKELNFRPGERFVYSNTGYTLLGEIVSRVSGKSLRQFTTEQIFSRLGMFQTHFRDDHAELIKGQAYGYVPDKNHRWRLGITNFDTVGATSLFTTVEDLSRWDENFYDHKLGGEQFVPQMLQLDRLNDGTMPHYAFGLVLNSYRGLATVEHLGSDAGYRAILIRFPNQHFSVACLCNAGPAADPGNLAHRVADVFLADQFKEPAPVSPTGPKEEEVRTLTGTYWNGKTDEVVNVAPKDGVLQISYSDTESVALHPLATNVFQLEDSPLELHFFTNADRHVILQTNSNYGSLETFRQLPVFKPTLAALAEYSGTYHSDEIEPTYEVETKDGQLVLRRLKHEPEVLASVVPDLFVTDFGTVRFVRGKQHRISGMLISSDRVYHLHFWREKK